MKRKLALLIAAVMTVAMVPATAFASTKLTAVDEIKVATDKKFVSNIELVKSNDQADVKSREENGKNVFDIYVTLTNGTFYYVDDDDDNNLLMTYLGQDLDKVFAYAADDSDAEKAEKDAMKKKVKAELDKIEDSTDQMAGIVAITKESSTKIKVTLDADIFNQIKGASAEACVLPIIAKANEVGDVVAKVTSNVTGFKTASEVIATAQTGKVEITSEGVKTFVEDESDDEKPIKDIIIDELTPDVLKGGSIKLKLSGNWNFVGTKYTDSTIKYDNITKNEEIGSISFLNEDKVVEAKAVKTDDDTIEIVFKDGEKTAFTPNVLTKMTIKGIEIKPAKKCKDGDVATITVSSLAKSKEFSNVKLEVAKMVKEAVTYSVEDKDLPVIWAGKYNDDGDANTLKVSIEENTGDILNTSRKATFTFPEGIEVVDIANLDDLKVGEKGTAKGEFKYEIDENVVTIWNYAKDKESDKTDLGIEFVINAAPTFSGDVNVKLGGEFDDVTFKVATVKAPYTVAAKTSEVLIDYRYVPVNDIVITEAEEGILKDKDQIVLAVEKMDFEDAGKVEVTEGDIDVDVDVDDNVTDARLYDSKISDKALLTLTVNDESTEASTIVISGLELYLDRTLPVGGYALTNIGGVNLKDKKDDMITVKSADETKRPNAINILWENSYDNSKLYDVDPEYNAAGDGLFKYKAVTVNDSYVDVITSARDQDDSTTNKKIIITVGASTMAVGTETVNLDAPAYINSENYTMLPVRAISEAFGATVNWDAASRTVTVLSGQRIISMTIGSRTMYINGTPVAMNTTAAIVNDRTFIPVRDLANSLGISAINWTEASGTVTLN